jgi:tRNA G18 (ribose-2'-O)-methylase SpoU
MRKSTPPENIPKTSIFLPSIRSGWNTGSFFRTADSLGVEKLFLSGLTPYPPHKEIAKTALDADMFVPFTYFSTDREAAEYIKSLKIKLIALELTEDAKALSSEHSTEIFSPENFSGVCIMVGNEVTGISDELLSYADELVFIPMKGKKQSMNVSIAGSIAMWEMMKNI